jgi:hypothetical protein
VLPVPKHAPAEAQEKGETKRSMKKHERCVHSAFFTPVALFMCMTGNRLKKTAVETFPLRIEEVHKK